MTKQGEELANVSHRIVFGRFDSHRIGVAAETRDSIGFSDASDHLIAMDERQIVFAVALKTAALAAV